MSPSPPAGFAVEPYQHAGLTHDVHRAGSGPAVLLIHEVPGIHPGVVDLGRRLIDAGFTVLLPSLFGRPGEPISPAALARALPRICVAREFAALADRTGPVASWLRGLAARAHAECGGPGVGVIGMCFTGGFALATAVEPAVLAAVASQPSLPLGVTARRRAALGLDPADLTALQERAGQGLRVLGLRFSGDLGCPAQRFQTLRRELGPAFESIEIDSSPGNPHGIRRRAHAVLTLDLVDRPGHPTRAALDRVLAFLAEQLNP